jgi:hypothetical protein
MRDPFKHSDTVFVAGENRVYIGELPPHLAHTGVPRDVARNELFKLIGREGNMLHFKTGTRYATSCSGKVLTSLQTGNEICFVEYRGARIKLDASYYMTGGRKLTKEDLDSLRTDDGRTLRQFLADEAAKPLEERL